MGWWLDSWRNQNAARTSLLSSAGQPANARTSESAALRSKMNSTFVHRCSFHPLLEGARKLASGAARLGEREPPDHAVTPSLFRGACRRYARNVPPPSFNEEPAHGSRIPPACDSELEHIVRVVRWFPVATLPSPPANLSTPCREPMQDRAESCQEGSPTPPIVLTSRIKQPGAPRACGSQDSQYHARTAQARLLRQRHRCASAASAS